MSTHSDKGGEGPALIDFGEFKERYVTITERYDPDARRSRPFVDLSKIYLDPEAIDMVAALMKSGANQQYDKVVGIEGMGSKIAPVTAVLERRPFVEIRNRHPLTGIYPDVVSKRYRNYRGRWRVMEVSRSHLYYEHEGSAKPRLRLIDDILGSGITAEKAAALLKDAGGEVVGIYVIVAVEEWGGLTRLERAGIPVDYILKI